MDEHNSYLKFLQLPKAFVMYLESIGWLIGSLIYSIVVFIEDHLWASTGQGSGVTK